ncbi:glycogen debranching protein GlgX [Janibacter sp. YB324]|uniref:glycogen debranching protein GlgX n=1 Tax=Janibacter sp. YB324 TaxID=2761047 RepID=UPI00162371E4|nr:glycogen debranching protein GlgX [Janibacter sp. YB324]QNF95031.1 glycogen debranching protein GlgX [Janibacter sp. YB324]
MSTTTAQPLPDRPAPGVRPVDGGVTVAVPAASASAVWLCLFDDEGEESRVSLPAAGEGWWGGFVPDVHPGARYGLRVDGPWDPAAGHRHNPAKLLLDPWGRAVEGRVTYEPAVYGHAVDESGDGDVTVRSELDSAPFVPRNVVLDTTFDWGDDAPPAHPRDSRVVYEAHVREVTRLLDGVPEHLRGTYAGMAHPVTIEHLQRLGVTTVELLPVHAFADEPHLVDLGLTNHWGYNTLGFFAPHAPYASDADPHEVLRELKGMVKLLHAAGIEVLLDVVYNHTAEQSTGGATLSWRGLDAATWYRLDEQGHDVDVTGCGNTLDLTEPLVLEMVLDSLRYWVEEVHVDGFRYDLAVALGRGDDLGYDPDHPFFVALREDPVLSRVLHVAEPWDLGPDGWRTGQFPRAWAEWNDRFRDATRDFWLADAGALSRGEVSGPGVREIATRLVGSRDLFGERTPLSSVSFVTAHDGFTMADLVAYDTKHNEANGEDNRDGNDHNRSWNHGAEGPTDDAVIALARRRSVRNLLGTLLLSAGVPMIASGDEIGRTHDGNNNPYCQDNEMTWLDWDLDDARHDLLASAGALTALRREVPVLRDHDESVIGWYDETGAPMTDGTWAQDERRTLQLHLAGEPAALIVVHGGLAEAAVTLPDVGPLRLRWDSAWERPQAADSGPADREQTLTPLSLRLYTT